jgi:hypothetical protein
MGSVRSCTYCGRENNEQAVHCFECGTELVRLNQPSRTPKIRVPMTPRTLKAIVRSGIFILFAVCVSIGIDVTHSFKSPIFPSGYILFIGSPLIFGFGLWITYLWSQIELKMVERVISGFLLLPSLALLGLAAAFDIFMIAIGGIGPP